MKPDRKYLRACDATGDIPFSSLFFNAKRFLHNRTRYRSQQQHRFNWPTLTLLQAVQSASVSLAAILWATFSVAAPAAAQWTSVSDRGTERGEGAANLALSVGEARTISVSPRAQKVFVANPTIADIDASKPDRLTIYGRAPGRTDVIITSPSGAEQTYAVQVGRPLEKIREAIKRATPSADVVLEDMVKGLRVGGSVATPQDAASIRAIIAGFIGPDQPIIFEAKINAGVQVLLQVRVAEVAKSARNFLGLNWASTALSGGTVLGFATGRVPTAGGAFLRSDQAFGSFGLNYNSGSGRTSIAGILDALKEQNLVSILAEPNLTAISGSRASFVAGGEFPVPVVQGRADFGTTTVEFKEFGIKVDFTPTVIDDGRINIKVYSEVSELSQIGAVTVNGISIPSLSVRKVDTTVELASGQSFAIAGLFKNNTTSITQGLPFLADIPILGALFRSRSFLRDESELVIMITPYIVEPSSSPDKLKMPNDDLTFGNELEQILLPRVTQKAAAAGKPRLVGPSGFMMEDRP